MKTYNIYKETKDSNTIVKELNAKVLTATFKNKSNVELADLYTYQDTTCGNPDEIVAHGTCAPIMGRFVETIKLKFTNE